MAGHLGATTQRGACIAAVFRAFHYNQRDVPLADSNAAFDASLRQKNAAWGLRFVEDIAEEAHKLGLRLDQVIDMPANNLSLIFRA
jgi:hypothetical protein